MRWNRWDKLNDICHISSKTLTDLVKLFTKPMHNNVHGTVYSFMNLICRSLDSFIQISNHDYFCQWLDKTNWDPRTQTIDVLVHNNRYHQVINTIFVRGHTNPNSRTTNWHLIWTYRWIKNKSLYIYNYFKVQQFWHPRI